MIIRIGEEEVEGLEGERIRIAKPEALVPNFGYNRVDICAEVIMPDGRKTIRRKVERAIPREVSEYLMEPIKLQDLSWVKNYTWHIGNVNPLKEGDVEPFIERALRELEDPQVLAEAMRVSEIYDERFLRRGVTFCAIKKAIEERQYPPMCAANMMSFAHFISQQEFREGHNKIVLRIYPKDISGALVVYKEFRIE